MEKLASFLGKGLSARGEKKNKLTLHAGGRSMNENSSQIGTDFRYNKNQQKNEKKTKDNNDN